MDYRLNSNFLGGHVSSFDELLATESFDDIIDFELCIDAVNSIPLYERLGIQENDLLESEIKQMKDKASYHLLEFNDRLEKRQATNQHKGNELAGISHDECNEMKVDVGKISDENIGNPRKFLSYLYNKNENDALITELQRNLHFDSRPTFQEPMHESLKDMHTLPTNLEKYLLQINSGCFDELPFKNATPLPSSSDSEEEISPKAREYSATFRTSKDEFRCEFLSNIVDDSFKVLKNVALLKEKANPHPNKWISSDEDSETEKLKRQSEIEAKRKKRRAAKSKNKDGQPKNHDTINPVQVIYEKKTYSKQIHNSNNNHNNKNAINVNKSGGAESKHISQHPDSSINVTTKPYNSSRNKQKSKQSIIYSSKNAQPSGSPNNFQHGKSNVRQFPSPNIPSSANSSIDNDNTSCHKISSNFNTVTSDIVNIQAKFQECTLTKTEATVSEKPHSSGSKDSKSVNLSIAPTDLKTVQNQFGQSLNNDDEWASIRQKSLLSVDKILKKSKKK